MVGIGTPRLRRTQRAELVDLALRGTAELAP
jgi:hypothetical protein